MPETTPLLSSSNDYYFLKSGGEASSNDAGVIVEAKPDGAEEEEFAPKQLPPQRKVRGFQIPLFLIENLPCYRNLILINLNFCITGCCPTKGGNAKRRLLFQPICTEKADKAISLYAEAKEGTHKGRTKGFVSLIVPMSEFATM